MTTYLEAVHAPGGAVRLPHLVVYGGDKEEELSRQSNKKGAAGKSTVLKQKAAAETR